MSQSASSNDPSTGRSKVTTISLREFVALAVTLVMLASTGGVVLLLKEPLEG